MEPSSQLLIRNHVVMLPRGYKDETQNAENVHDRAYSTESPVVPTLLKTGKEVPNQSER